LVLVRYCRLIRALSSFPTRTLFRSSGDGCTIVHRATTDPLVHAVPGVRPEVVDTTPGRTPVWGDLSLDALGLDLVDDRRVGQGRSEEHTSELQSRFDLVCRLLLENN